MRALFAVAWIELARLRRSRIAFTLLLLVPAMQVLLFGYAIRPGGGQIGIAIAAPAPVYARTLVAALKAHPGLAPPARIGPPGSAAAAVAAGRALIGIEIPEQRSFANPFAPIRPVRVVVDASDAPRTAAAVPQIEAIYWRAQADGAGAGDGGAGLAIERRYNPDLRADWTFLPALIGVTVMIGMIMLGTLSLAREREGGTWEALLILPIRPVEALLGKLLPYVLIGTLQGLLVLAAGVLLFDLPVRGSVAALIALLPLFAAAHLVIGYALSARAPTQLAALQGAVAFYLPAMLLSGFLYPFETLPRWAQLIGSIFPLTHFIAAARGALLRGDGAAAVLAQGQPMFVFLLIVGAAALLLQARRLD